MIFLDFEYVDSDKFNSPKIRLVRDSNGNLFVRKSTDIDGELAEKLKAISSQYIVKFFEFGEDENGSYVIEEYVEGVSASEQSLTKKQAVRALVELCEALEVLHSAKIIHRDIKPSNIIIATDGHIRLIDFDASRIEKTIQDKDTQILGTEGFAPPEQFGFAQTDCRSDIYSLGVTMKLLLGENSAQFNDIIKKCKALDPENRYQSISQVKTAIRLAAFKKAAFIPLTAVLTVGFALAFTTVFSAVINRDTSVYLPEQSTSSGFESSTVESDTSSVNSSTSSENSSSVISSSGSSTSESSASTGNSHSSSSKAQSGSQAPQTPEEQFVLHTSDMDNPNKITFSTFINSQGYYEDKCEYVFYNDATVSGNWEAVGLIGKEELEYFASGTIGANPMEVYIKYLWISSDGWARLYYREGGVSPAKWTNGYLVSTVNHATCEEMFTVNVGGERFLLQEVKTGDYQREKKAYSYFVYKSVSSIPDQPDSSQSSHSSQSSQTPQAPDTENSQPNDEPEFVLERSDNNNPNKITYYTVKNDKGYYEDRFDQYVFYDDPTVHGSWKNVGRVSKKDLTDWAAGKIFMTPNRDTVWISGIMLDPDGTAAMPNNRLTQHWTNGYYINLDGDGQTVMELFTVNVNGTEYLLLETKAGDYLRELKSDFYFIFERE